MQQEQTVECRPYKISILKVLGMLVLILLIQFLLGAIFYAAMSTQPLSLHLIVNTLVQVGSYLLIIYLFYWRHSQRLNLQRQKGVSIFLILLLAIGLAFFALLALQPIIELLPKSPAMEEAVEEMIETPFLALILIIGIAPFFEEIIFRNIILKGLKNRYNAPLAAVLSSLLFGAFHLNFQQFVTASVLGFACAALYLMTDSVFYTMLLHAFYNTAVVVLSILFSDETGLVPNVSPWVGWLGLPIILLILWQIKQRIERYKLEHIDTVIIEREGRL